MKGLTSAEAENRLKENGKNILNEEKKKSKLKIITELLFNLTNGLLAAAIIILVCMNEYSQAAIMLFIILANTAIGAFEEIKASNALESLKQMMTIKTTVFRDGQPTEINASDVVVGDIVLIEAGKEIPADLLLTETANLKIDEKMLTGESVPVEKDEHYKIKNTDEIGDQKCNAYMSTICTYGRGEGIVTATGMNTQIGKIANMLQTESTKLSPLQQGMNDFSKLLGIACVVICALMFGIGMIQKRDIIEMLLTSVSLAVAAIPEGIPTIVVIVLALGMKHMVEINAIVKSLSAVETLGSVGIVCSDKTGTMTQNKMTVVETWTPEKKNITHLTEQLFINGFVLCNDASISSDGIEIGDPTETALIQFGKNKNVLKDELEKTMPRINEKPFDSDRKLMTTVHTMGQTIISFTKGSTDELISRCTKIRINDKEMDLTPIMCSDIMNAMSEMSMKALRVLSIAYRIDNPNAIEQDLVYLGMVGMIDPERPEVKESIQIFKNAGIETVMITGDHKDTAFAIASKLGITDRIDDCIMGHELDTMSDEELKERIKNLRVFARVSPEHKVRIVNAFQANGYVVSMTGDGVNDAPSLKAANVGIAMGITGTDVAKGAADIILQDDKFTSIEKAIQEGRRIYDNVKKSILFAVSSNICEVIAMFIAILANLPSPLISIQILWVNLLTDSLPCFALGIDTNTSRDIMQDKPRKADENLFAHGGYTLIGIYGLLIAAICLIGYLFAPILYLIDNNVAITYSNILSALNITSVLDKARTYAFCLLAFCELSHAIGMRDIKTSIFKMNHLNNKLMMISLAIGLIGQMLVINIPLLRNSFNVTTLSVTEWIVLILVSVIPLIMHEILVPIMKKK